MEIPLDQFELHINNNILKRGLSYYEDGCVNEVEEITEGVYEAIVSGSEDYTVEIEVIEGVIKECICSCPYDLGPVCKHVVAVLFYLQQDVLQIEEIFLPENKSKRKNATKRAKKKTVLEQINVILQNVSYEELQRFITEKAKDDTTFRNILFTYFAGYNTSESKEMYNKFIQSILRKEGGRNGFIYWNQTGAVRNHVEELINTAQKQIERKNFKTAFFICTAVLEEMTKALDFSDDSNGDISGIIEFTFELLVNLSKENIPSEVKNEVFDYCISAFRKQIFAGWDWHLGILDLASEISKGKEDLQKVLDCLDTIHGSAYEIEEAQFIKLGIIRKLKGEKDADSFIEQNLTNPILRRELIAKSLKNGDYNKAIAIAKDGIKWDGKYKPGLAMEWHDWLLKIALAQNDIQKIIEYARILFINNFRHEQDYYQLLKNNVAPELWREFLENVIQDIRKSKSWSSIELVAKIYINEQWFDRLFELVKRNASLSYIEQHERFLIKDYSKELVTLYTNEIMKYVKNSVGRNHYQTACKYLRRIKKLGDGIAVEKIILDLKKQYPQRRALIEELNLV